jgi:hypothetical protein
MAFLACILMNRFCLLPKRYNLRCAINWVNLQIHCSVIINCNLTISVKFNLNIFINFITDKIESNPVKSKILAIVSEGPQPKINP